MKKEQGRKREYVECPACLQSIPLKAGYCTHCGRYQQSLEEVDLLQSDALFSKSARGYTFSLRWVRNRKHKVMLYASYFIWVVMGAILYFDLSAGEPFGIEQKAQLAFVVLAFYGSLVMSLNKTVIEVDGDFARVWRGPVPVPFAPSFYVSRSDVIRVDLFKMKQQESGYLYSIYLVGQNEKIYDLISSEDEELSKEVYLFLLKLWGATRPKVITKEEYTTDQNSFARTLSRIYNMGFVLALVGNLPLAALWSYWRFDAGLLVVFAACFLGIFTLYYTHHRKYLFFWNSQPLKPGQQNAGAGAYLIITFLITLLLTPYVMSLYLLLLLIAGR